MLCCLELRPHQVPDVVPQQVEQIVDGLPEVAPAQEVVQVRLDGAEVGAELHLRDLHVALGVEDDGGLGVDVQVVDLEPDVPVPVQGEQAHDQTGQVVPGVTLHSTNQSNM